MCEKITELFEHKIHIYNEYGPTEATVGCMIYEYNKDDNYTSVPIGKPIDNTQILLLNNNLEISNIENNSGVAIKESNLNTLNEEDIKVICITVDFLNLNLDTYNKWTKQPDYFVQTTDELNSVLNKLLY